MKQIAIKKKVAGNSDFHDDVCYGVMDTIRKMKPDEEILFPADWNEAVRAATSILQDKNMDVRSKVVTIDGVKYLRVTKGKNKVYMYKTILSPTEPRPDKPYELVVPIMGTEAHLATISMGRTKVDEDNVWYAETTVSKGNALSDEFWNANYERIGQYIETTLRRSL